MTQNMESGKNMVHILPVAGGGVGPKSPLPVTIRALAGEKIVWILLEI